MNKNKFPAVFITHGGGPCFFMDWNPPDAWIGLADWLKNFSVTLPDKPKAILVISAHWEEKHFTINKGNEPLLLFDYYGFPEHTYQLEYPAPGNLLAAEKIAGLLKEKGFEIAYEEKRGWDHGVFIPLKLMFPRADIPVIQLSLKNNLSPTEHLNLGKVLRVLREEEILIIGSGSSYHNLSAFNNSGKEISRKFDHWLTEILQISDSEEREEKLANWSLAPSAKLAHPREEHLIPLMVVAGAASKNEIGKKVFSQEIMGIILSCFQFG